MKRIEALEKRVNTIFGTAANKYSQLMSEIEKNKSMYIRLQEIRVKAYAGETKKEFTFDRTRYLKEWETKIKPAIVQDMIDQERNPKPMFPLTMSDDERKTKIDIIMNSKKKLSRPDYIK
jgi:hypothetical protein